MPDNNFAISRKVRFLLLVFSSLLFGFSNSFFAWFLFLPMLILVKELPFTKQIFYGFAYGFLSYFFLLSWMLKFSLLALFASCLLYAFYWALIFCLLKFIINKFSILSIFLIPFAITLFEYIRSQGFFGFTYGINAYSQAENIYFIQLADLVGLYGLSFVLNLSSTLLFYAFYHFKKEKFKELIIIFIPFLTLVFGIYIYGFVRIYQQKRIENNAEKITVCAIQNNADPWKGGIDFYEKSLDDLISLSLKAIEENPDIELLVWPETAVVPSILKHYDSQDLRRKRLVNKLLNFIESQKPAFVIGNFNSIDGKDFNSAFYFSPGKNVIPPRPLHYEKKHLVPFCEYFPYKDYFPYFYEKLLKGDTHMWEPGSSDIVFEHSGFKFSTPICFEDTFDYDCRRMVKNGARALVNLSNDAWSKSYRCQKQHLQAAVFRCVENRVPAIRSCSSGQTCIINTYGKITFRIKAFEQNYLVGKLVKLAT